MLNEQQTHRGEGAPLGAPRPLLLDDEGVAAALAVNVNTVRNLHRSGILPGACVGKFLRWHPADVQDYADSLRRKATVRE